MEGRYPVSFAGWGETFWRIARPVTRYNRNHIEPPLETVGARRAGFATGVWQQTAVENRIYATKLGRSFLPALSALSGWGNRIVAEGGSFLDQSPSL